MASACFIYTGAAQKCLMKSPINYGNLSIKTVCSVAMLEIALGKNGFLLLNSKPYVSMKKKTKTKTLKVSKWLPWKEKN